MISKNKTSSTLWLVGGISLLCSFVLEALRNYIVHYDWWIDVLIVPLLYVLAHSSIESLRMWFKPQSTVRTEKLIRWWNIGSFFVSVFSLCFLATWLGRWLGLEGSSTPISRFRPLLHAGWLTACIALVMKSRRVYLWSRFVELTPGRLVFSLYGISCFMGGFLLILPWSLNRGVSVSLVDGLFISVSALTVTGLTTVNVAQTFSSFGKLIILGLIQLGGLGIVVISVSLVFLAQKKLSLAHSMMGKQLYDIPSLGNLGKFLRRVLGWTVLVELAGVVYLYFSLPDSKERFLTAVFHAISAFCNAGFSLFENNLDLSPAGSDYMFFHAGICVLIIIGGMGFPVLFELWDKMLGRQKGRGLSANTHLTLWIGLALWALGTIALFVVRCIETGSTNEILTKFSQSLFYSVSARTAGFNVSDMQSFGGSSKFLLSILMIIGGAPLSTAGGIKTTTAGIMIVAAWSVLRGHKWVQFRHTEIPNFALQKAVTVLVLYGFAMFSAIVVLILLEPHTPLALTFEVISSLSTVGLSLGITGDLSVVSKVIFMGLMLAGRLGLVTIVYIGMGRVVKQRFRYAADHFYIG